MNRSFHAFAVLLVSLAGGMIAATWTSTLPTRRPVMHAIAMSHAPSKPLYCSCNPEGMARFEQGCARDKTTGELYGCGLGLGNNGASGKSVIGRTANSIAESLTRTADAIRSGVAGIPWQKFAAQTKWLESELAVIHAQVTPDRTHEQDYAAAELAAAGFDPSKPSPVWLNLNETLNRTTESTVSLLGNLSRQWDRLQRYWDTAEQAVRAEQERLASARMQMEEENFDRWFENFPPPVTQPNRLINPIEPKDDSEESRRIILATAKALETLSGWLHQTAENLARHAEQDVAELHKLKSGIEERR